MTNNNTSFLNKQIAKFKQKSLFGKISDIVFYLLLILIFIPSTRKVIVSNTVRVIMQPIRSEAKIQPQLEQQDLNWKLYTPDGELIVFSELMDKPVIVNYWATWCPHCLAEMPELNNFYLEYKDRVNVVFLASDDKNRVQDYMNKNGYNFPVYFRGEEPKVLRTEKLPTVFIVNNGKVIFTKTGAIAWDSDKTKEKVEQMLNLH